MLINKKVLRWNGDLNAANMQIKVRENVGATFGPDDNPSVTLRVTAPCGLMWASAPTAQGSL